MAQVNGFHHITAIAGDAQRNYNFYTKVLGLRMVKKTVNFDDPHTYHFYFGNEAGEPGTILTFFPWQNVKRGKRGSGMATEFSYSVPEGALGFWVKRLDEMNVLYTKPSGRMGENYIAFEDPDGLKIELVEVADDKRQPYTEVVPADYALRGFYSATLTINSYKQTADILMNGLGFELAERQGNRYRFTTDANGFANVIDLVELPSEGFGTVAGGCVHHIAFSVPDDDVQEEVRKKMRSMGMNPTAQIDRQYFHSVYFREPGGVLFEIATDTPGFAIDEEPDKLGTSLKLPPQYEQRRQEIEKALPDLEQ